LITGSDNSLVNIVDDNDQGNEIIWANNLMHPTGSATILTGASATAFDLAAVSNEDPHLIYDDVFGSWRSTGDTPLFENLLLTDEVKVDIDGQERPSVSNPGADQFSLESIRFRPLTPMDVGPAAFENTSTSTSDPSDNSKVLLFPVPAKNVLYLSNLNNRIKKIRVINSAGQVCLEQKIIKPENGLSLNISKLVDGIYIVQFFGVDNFIESKSIVIHH